MTKTLKDAGNGVAFVTDANQSYYAAEQGVILIKGQDGQAYGIYTDDLHIEKSTADPAKLFSAQAPELPDYTDGITIALAEDHQYNLFLTETDVQNLLSGAEISTMADDRAERRFIYNGRLQEPEKLKKISEEVFLMGSFLFSSERGDSFYTFESPDKTDFSAQKSDSEALLKKAQEDAKNGTLDTEALKSQMNQNANALADQIQESTAMYRQYVRVYGRGTLLNYQPFQREDKDIYYVLHHQSVEYATDSLLFSAVNIKTGAVLWTVDLKGRDIRNFGMLDETHMIIFVDDGKSGSTPGASSHFCYLNMENGSGFAYNYAYDYSSVLQKFSKEY